MKSEAIYTNSKAGKTLVRIHKAGRIEWAVCRDYDDEKPEGRKWSSAKYFLDDFEGAVKEATTGPEIYKEESHRKKYDIYFKEGEDYHEVSHEQISKFIDDWENFKYGHGKIEPSATCLIAVNKEDEYPWVALDNRTGDCWVENFKTKEEAIYWLQDTNYDPYENEEKEAAANE